MELNMNTMIKVPNLLVDPAIWQGMITNLTTTKFPFMDLLRVADNEYTVTMNGYILSVEGVWNSIDEKNVKYLVEGIAKRDFKREIPLAEHIQVGDVDLIDGMLYIQLQRDIPEELKPKSFAIRGA